MADKPQPRTRKFRVLRDFTDGTGKEYKVDDEIEMTQEEAQGWVNAGHITAGLESR